jgi:hypothetical protein
MKPSVLNPLLGHIYLSRIPTSIIEAWILEPRLTPLQWWSNKGLWVHTALMMTFSDGMLFYFFALSTSKVWNLELVYFLPFQFLFAHFFYLLESTKRDTSFPPWNISPCKMIVPIDFVWVLVRNKQLEFSDLQITNCKNYSKQGQMPLRIRGKIWRRDYISASSNVILHTVSNLTANIPCYDKTSRGLVQMQIPHFIDVVIPTRTSATIIIYNHKYD